jgi:4a-hydroxytetrahydrobiopterin dehydratase
MNNICLANKACMPCQGEVPLSSNQEADRLLELLGNAWQINQAGHLYKQYEFSDFIAPMNLANQIAILAEQEAHNPDLTISWGMCKVEIWTHKIKGLSESDFILAAKIEDII